MILQSGFGEACCLHSSVSCLLPWRLKQQVALKHTSPLTIQQDVIIKMINLNLTIHTVCPNTAPHSFGLCAYSMLYAFSHFTSPLTRLLRQTVTQDSVRATAEAVSRRLPTAAARVRCHVRSCWIRGGHSGSVFCFLGSLWFPLTIIIPWNATH
jgi:hypothetical protein